MAFQNRYGDFERKMYKGEWKCAKCGTAITELPFNPDPSRIDQLQCRDCHRQSRATERNRY